MKKKLFIISLNIGLSALLITSCKKDEPAEELPSATPYISKVFEYKPAPGQFINSGQHTQEGAQGLIGGRDALISLGGYGGYLIFGFDHAVENKDGADLGIFGNPLYNEGMEWSEPGIVMVMQDLNNNGLPDDGEWYELAGSEHAAASTLKNYRITYYKPQGDGDDIRWDDNQGNSGYILKNQFHTQRYFPAWASGQGSVSFTGTLLKNTLTPGGIITNKPFEWGYADNGSEELIRLGYNTFDISRAVNSQGNSVALSYINFVKVYTGQNSNGNPSDSNDVPDVRKMGEISTEISGAVDIHLFTQNN